MNELTQYLFGGGAAAGLAGAAWAFLRSATGKAFMARLRTAALVESASLREALDNLSQVVATQGQSIEWLREELTATRLELEEARSALNDKESRLEKENEKLRTRVAELEAQVKALEAALARRSRTTKTATTKAAAPKTRKDSK